MSLQELPRGSYFLEVYFLLLPGVRLKRVTEGPQHHLQEVSKPEAGQDAHRDQPRSASGSILLADTLKEKAIAQLLICSCPLCSLQRGTPGQELAPMHSCKAVSTCTLEMPAWTQSPCGAETPRSYTTPQSCSTGSPPACRCRKSDSFPPK